MNKPNSCSQCPLYQIGYSFSNCEGEAKFGVAFIGEALGKHEASEGLPFRSNGESGSLLTHIVERNLKLKRSDFLWDNIVKCQPPNNILQGASYEEDAIRSCGVYNSRSIDNPQVRCIVAFGGVAFKALTGIEGKKRNIEDVRGYVFKYNDKFVVPTLHPAFVRRGNSRFTSAVIHDIKKAIAIAGGNYTSFQYHVGFVMPVFV